MDIWYKKLEEMDEDFLNELIENRVSESRTVDYKKGLRPRNPTNFAKGLDADELCIDIVQFANTIGGYLFVGIDEEKGIPTKIIGIDCPNFDRLKQHIEACVKKIEPYFSAFKLHLIPLESGKSVIVIRVERSWKAPHRAAGKFYYRTNSGHEIMSVDQIRDAVVSSAGLESQFRTFRRVRTLKLLPNPKSRLNRGMRVAVHIVPLVGASGSTIVDVVNNIQTLTNSNLPGYSRGYVSMNVDGCCWNSNDFSSPLDAYYQWFRNGCCELVWTIQGQEPIGDGPPIVPVYNEIQYGEYMVKGVALVLSAYEKLFIPPPYIVGVTLASCTGWILGQARNRRAHPRQGCLPVNEYEFEIDEIMIDRLDRNVPTAMKPILTQVANAFGILKSGNYGSDGKWLGELIEVHKSF
jgi:hypothetical protein